MTWGTLSTAQLGEKAEEEVDAWKQEDGDEKDDAGKLWVILKVQKGITSRLAWKKDCHQGTRYKIKVQAAYKCISRGHLKLGGQFEVLGRPDHKVEAGDIGICTTPVDKT